MLPAPVLRLREGQNVRLAVTNQLDEDTSIHWHGILLPFQMDGVPGVSFPGIRPRETFVYEFPVRQSGTFWYHSHSGLQEALGHYGPIVIDPAGADPVAYDREHVLVLSDWSFMHPHEIFDKLKKSPGYFNRQRTTLAGLLDGSDRMSLEERRMWGEMRMDPRDILDVNGSTYTYLINGHGPRENWTGLFRPGERVRLRIINASAMSIFNVRIPGLPMTVVQADGENVRPIETDELQISVAETYDVIVQSHRGPRLYPRVRGHRPIRHGARHPGAPAGHDGRGSAAEARSEPDPEGHGHGGHGRHGRHGSRRRWEPSRAEPWPGWIMAP